MPSFPSRASWRSPGSAPARRVVGTGVDPCRNLPRTPTPRVSIFMCVCERESFKGEWERRAEFTSVWWNFHQRFINSVSCFVSFTLYSFQKELVGGGFESR